MTTGGGGDDRLSSLSDDLLRRILYFAPSKAAASTSALSRRWGSLWRSSGAVNLAVQVYDCRKMVSGYGDGGQHGRSYSSYEEAEDAFFSDQEAFVGAAKAALDAAEAPITRLTLRVESDDDDNTVSKFLCCGRGWGTGADVVGDLVSHQAARRVEELRIAVAAPCSDFRYSLGQENHTRTGIYRLVFLPSSETLRVLDLTSCDLRLSAAAASAPLSLPRLATLRLRDCSVEDLQALLDAAPELTTVQLESLLFLAPLPPYGMAEAEPPVLRLSFHAVTTLVLVLCGLQHGGSGHCRGGWAIEIDAPRLQSFTYKGLMRPFTLRPPPAAPGVARVDLHFLRDNYHCDSDIEDFWQFMHNFGNARTLRLKVDDDLKHIAATGKEMRARLMCAFPSVERLVLDGVHRPRSKTAAVAIANLLHCCPVVGEIMLKLSTVPDGKHPSRYRHGRHSRYRHGPEFLLQKKDRLDYNKSIDRFVRRRKPKTTAISMEDSIVCDKYLYDGVPGIPGLSGRSFACLQRTLRRVGLQFRLDNDSISSCLGVRLIKFFAGHAGVLEEICVDTGNRRLYEHLNFNAVTQIALAPIPISATASIDHKNREESSSEFSRVPGASVDSTTELARSTVGITVLPLQR